MAYRSLGTLRGILSARLGFAASGASIGANATLMDSWLQNGQYQLYMMQNWKKLTKYEDKTIGINQYLTDYPTTANPERILKIAVNVGSTSTPDWRLLTEGIETQDYNNLDLVSYPKKYERYEQIETTPKCDAVRTMRIWFIKNLNAFTQDAHLATIDDEMILLHATATGKAHYRHPDKDVWASQLNGLLEKIRGFTFGNKRFLAPGTKDAELPPRPQVV